VDKLSSAPCHDYEQSSDSEGDGKRVHIHNCLVPIGTMLGRTGYAGSKEKQSCHDNSHQCRVNKHIISLSSWVLRESDVYSRLLGRTWVFEPA